MSSVAPSLVRKNHGRNHSYYIDGEKVPGVTTVLGNGYPKPALIGWAAKSGAQFVLNRWDDLLEMQPAERYEAVLGARYSEQKEASERGTEVHKLIHRYIGGEEVTPPEDLALHFEHGCDFVDRWGVDELLVERPVFSRRYRYAGTPDLIARLADGRTWLLDWKTSKRVYPDNVLQLAALRYAEYVVDADGAEQLLADVVGTIEATGIVHLTAEGAELIPVEANESALRHFLAVALVARFDASHEDWIGDAIRPPVSTERTDP